MSLKTCKTAYGEFTFYGKDEYIGRSLYHYGEWSGLECSMLQSLSRGGVFVDCGANIGFMSAAMVGVASSVVSFEPQAELCKLLRKNVPSAIVHNVALSNSSGVASMPRIRYGDRGNYGGLGFGRSELGIVPVEMKELDSYGLKDVDLIKIDVEGHELGVICGALRLIEECRPILYVEDDREDKRYALRKFITGLGYEIEEHNPPMFRKDNFAGLDVNIWDKFYISKNIICRPKC